MSDLKHYTAIPMNKGFYDLGESPFYVKETDTFSWVDIVNGTFYKMKEGEITSLAFTEQIGAAIPQENGSSYLVMGTKGIYKVDAALQQECIFDLTAVYDDNHRSNDAKCDPRGRIFFGATALSGAPSGALYSYDNRNVKILQDSTLIANGMAWSKDQTKFYFSDSEYHQVFVYDYNVETGDISNRQVLCQIENGVPDGLTIDEQDNIWVAIWGGNRVECREGRTGDLLAVIDVPAKQVTSCTFYGEQNGTLFITSAGIEQTGAQDGGLFTCKIK